MKQEKIDTWDYQWTFTLWSQNQFTILPNVNLISNIGFGVDATHTTSDSEFSKLISYDLVLKNHPLHVEINKEADKFTAKLMFVQKTIFERIKYKIKRVFR